MLAEGRVVGTSGVANTGSGEPISVRGLYILHNAQAVTIGYDTDELGGLQNS